MASPIGDITKYLGVNYAFAPTYVRDRAPLISDTQDDQGFYKVPSVWVHLKSSVDPVDADVWILVNLQANNANGATWLLFTGGTGGSVTELRADDGNVAAPAAGIIDVNGNTVANATHAQPLFTRANIANTLDLDIQVGAAITVPADNNDAGLLSADSSAFTVDANGWLQLLGGGTATTNFETDDGAPNVVPDGSGEVQVLGGTNIVTSGQGPGNTITIDASGFASWTCVEVSADPAPMVPFVMYVVNDAGSVTMTLPSTSTFGDQFVIIRKGAGAVSIAQNASQTIHYNGVDTTTGAGGSLDSNAKWDVIWIKTVTTDTDFVILNSSGSWTAN
ncbi:MAG: hypothetical protein PVF17_00625 [Ignavibacteria bacterium]|jgi:hypothetical protein